MTLREYINNPAGKGTAGSSAYAREKQREDYEKRWGSIMLRENGKIRYFCYFDNKHNTYYFHVKVPSETVKNFYYDTVIKFISSKNVVNAGRDLLDHDIKLWSNDPAFCYTYCYALNEKKMLINELDNKMIKDCLRKKPVEKNPQRVLGYIKSVYFVYLFMKSKKLNIRDTFNNSAMNFTIGHLSGNIEDAETKVRNRQEKSPEREEPKKEKRELSERQKETQAMSRIKPLGNIGKIIPKAKITRSNNGIGHFNGKLKKK